MAGKPTGRKPGAPTKYTEDMPNRLYEEMAKGNSVTQFAANIGVLRETVYRWAKRHPEFGLALTRGKEASEAYWQKELQTMMYDKNVNAPLVKLYFANRFDWHDKAKIDNQSSDGSMTPNRIQIIGPDDDDGEDPDPA